MVAAGNVGYTITYMSIIILYMIVYCTGYFRQNFNSDDSKIYITIIYIIMLHRINYVEW